MHPGVVSIEVYLLAPTAVCQQLSTKEQTWYVSNYCSLSSQFGEGDACSKL